jgi:hypothetical protein
MSVILRILMRLPRAVRSRPTVDLEIVSIDMIISQAHDINVGNIEEIKLKKRNRRRLHWDPDFDFKTPRRCQRVDISQQRII